ncbi:hypothetical protein KR767_19645 [Luteibacter anthropi]|uniref:hypothetical protein n=1 Tax=Luteibacter anthropi TaxID=564369 RepID=UPI002032C66D|nr:hypothetical protein [Luteibacter anthropi]URX62228.1 hypothetical protein KR767_19645 [Luteibacter anthropi]
MKAVLCLVLALCGRTVDFGLLLFSRQYGVELHHGDRPGDSARWLLAGLLPAADDQGRDSALN